MLAAGLQVQETEQLISLSALLLDDLQYVGALENHTVPVFEGLPVKVSARLTFVGSSNSSVAINAPDARAEPSFTYTAFAPKYIKTKICSGVGVTASSMRGPALLIPVLLSRAPWRCT